MATAHPKIQTKNQASKTLLEMRDEYSHLFEYIGSDVSACLDVFASSLSKSDEQNHFQSSTGHNKTIERLDRTISELGERYDFRIQKIGEITDFGFKSCTRRRSDVEDPEQPGRYFYRYLDCGKPVYCTGRFEDGLFIPMPEFMWHPDFVSAFEKHFDDTDHCHPEECANHLRLLRGGWQAYMVSKHLQLHNLVHSGITLIRDLVKVAESDKRAAADEYIQLLDDAGVLLALS